MDEERLAEIEANYERFATDQDMPNAEWEALQLQVLKDHYDLQREVRRLQALVDEWERGHRVPC